jgi:hypothetical protein
MGRARRVVQEERLVRRDRLRVLDELDGLVGDVGGEVVSLLGGFGQAMELRVWLRPVSRHERVGEHSAVVCHWLNRTPLAAIRSMFGVAIGPP